jgi:hypothetical protein
LHLLVNFSNILQSMSLPYSSHCCSG